MSSYRSDPTVHFHEGQYWKTLTRPVRVEMDQAAQIIIDEDLFISGKIELEKFPARSVTLLRLMRSMGLLSNGALSGMRQSHSIITA